MSLFAGEVKNVTSFQPSRTLVQGDVVKIKIQIWPVEDYDENSFLKYKNNIFLEHFYVTEIKASRSENNYDVIILEVDAIVESIMAQGQNFNLVFGNYMTVISIPFEVEKLEGFNGQVVILEQSVEYEAKNIIYVLAIVLFLIAAVLVMHYWQKIISPFNKKKKLINRKIYFQTLFHNANEREHFEEIYSKKSEWLEYIPEKSNAVLVFFKTIEEHQYKKSWNRETVFEVRDSFDKIRGGIK